MLDYNLSIRVAGLIEADEYRCWYNAWKAITQLPGLFVLACYTEGGLSSPEEVKFRLSNMTALRAQVSGLSIPPLFWSKRKIRNCRTFPDFNSHGHDTSTPEGNTSSSGPSHLSHRA